MILANFDEWFAIRSNHRDDDHWPGRLVFSLEDGIRLTTARFADSASGFNDPTFNQQTITGWLDYQQPATVIQPKTQSVGGLSIGINTPAMRVSHSFVVDAVIKNVFLEDISDPIFTGVILEHPAVHAWINPSLTKHEWSWQQGSKPPVLAVEISPPTYDTFDLSDQIKVNIESATRIVPASEFSISDYTNLEFSFSKPFDYKFVSRFAWRVCTLFDFMVGRRTVPPVLTLPTVQTREWNGEERNLIAEIWYRPARSIKNLDIDSSDIEPMISVKRSSIATRDLMVYIMGDHDELLHAADVIQNASDHSTPIPQRFAEIVGVLEDFDRRYFGDDSSPTFEDEIESLEKIVKQYGSNTDQSTFNRLRPGTRNGYSFLHRLKRLHNFWETDGFRGSPKLSRIRDLRNLVSHGRGLELSIDVAQEMSIYIKYLSALGRYHIWRIIGYSADEIGIAFMSQPHRYGCFVPERLIERDFVTP